MITLKLTREEARVLHQILYNIGGSPVKSGRKLADSIFDKLYLYKRDYFQIDTKFNLAVEGRIIFKENKHA